MTRFAALTLAGAFMALGPTAHAADAYVFDKGHTQIMFSISHLGFSMTHGSFKEFDGSISIDEGDIAKSSVDVTIQMASVDTGHAKRDEHIKDGEWLKVEEFPTMRFVSTSVEQTGDTTAKILGDLSFRGMTKPVTLDVELRGRGENPFSKDEVIGFTASTTIQRSEFGFDHALPAIGDDVSIVIETELNPA
ncbi:MAG: YceI family protein [Pseudomonadota bacterium]